jgi:integrase
MGRRRRKQRYLPQNMRESHGSYYWTHYVDGKQEWTPLGKDLTAAFGKYRELTGAAAPIGRTVDDLVTRFDLEVVPKKRANTQRVYRVWMPAIRRTWGQMLLKDLRQPDVAVFLDTYPKKVTANRVVTLLVTMLKSAKRWGWIETNHIMGIERHPEHARRRIISDDEWKALLAAADGQYPLLLRLARYTALRRSDVCSLTWGCVQNGRLVLTTQKTQAPLSIAIRGELAAVFAELRKGILPHPTRRLFWVAGGRPLTTAMLGYHFDRIRAIAKLRPINFHDIRRTRLTELGEKYGAEFAQKLAAHSDIKTTERYIVPEVIEVDFPEDDIRGAG